MRLIATILLAGGMGIQTPSVAAQTTPASEASFEEPRPFQATAFSREWRQWSQELFCDLLDHPTPLVRVRVHAMIEARKNDPDAIQCPIPLPETSAFRLEALLADPENPALIAAVYHLECTGQRPREWCRETDLRQRLVDVDPDNAFPHLLYLERSNVRAREKNLTFSGEELEHLLQAASSKTLDSYYAHGMPEAYDALETALKNKPPNDWSDEARLEFSQLGFDMDDPADAADFAALQFLLSHNIVLGADMMVGIYNPCRAAVEARDEIAAEGCTALGKLAARHANTEIGKRVGLALQFDEDGESVDPQDWQYNIEILIQFCAMPRGILGDRGLPAPMPDGETLLWLQEIVDLGEGPASKRKVAREYALYPEAFPMNPSDCDAIRTLPDDEQETLVRRWENSTGDDRTDAALKRAAAMLK